MSYRRRYPESGDRPGLYLAWRLILHGPNVYANKDDAESAKILEGLFERWRALVHAIRDRVHLASLQTADLEVNGAIVNALQREASVVVQKSGREGFGL